MRPLNPAAAGNLSRTSAYRWNAVVATLCALTLAAPLAAAGQSLGAAEPRWIADLSRMNATWPSGPPIESLEDAFRLRLFLDDQVLVLDTHLFRGPLVIVPYHDEDDIVDAAGEPIERGDQELSRLFPPGEIGFAVRHRRPRHRTLSLSQGETQIKEEIKMRDGHVEIVVGVMRDGKPGVVTLNSPQTYERGRFGGASYPMIFLRPIWPEALSASSKIAFRDNVRTMMAGFAAVADFPLNYIGGDPVGARDADAVRQHTAMMLRAIAGDEQAKDWFRNDQTRLYCSELAFLAASAGLLVPLNANHTVPLVGEEVWQKVRHEIEVQQAGGDSNFSKLSRNPLSHLVDLTEAPAELEPVAAYLPGNDNEERLAWKPMTMADLVERFLALYLPRSELGEELAPLQGKLLAATRKGVLETLGMHRLPEDDPQLIQVLDLFDRIVEIVSVPHQDYETFRQHLEPLLEQAREVSGPSPLPGAGLFVPPSLLHLVARGDWTGGLLGLEYVGHGLHFSLVRRNPTAQ